MTGSLVAGARYAIAPADIAATGWPRIERTCRNIGWRFDPWQRDVGRLVLAKRADGAWAADLSLLSIPRQVGKSYLLGCIIFAQCLLTPGLRVIWTSHHTATTEEMYEAMKALAAHSRVAPHVKRCAALQGSRWRITFSNGARIEFGARERGFGRGKARVGVLVLDEFQHITMRALANLTPTTNTAENPLILCAGTPPAPHDNAEAFTARRSAAIDGTSSDTLYVEFSADRDADTDDRAQWAKANPSFPKRTPERAFLLNRKILDEENFRREFLGIWGATGGGRVIPASAWHDRADDTSSAADHIALGIEVAPDMTHASVAVSGRRADGDWHIALAERRDGADWVAEYVKTVVNDNPGSVAAVAIDERSPTSMIQQDLRDAGIRTMSPKTNELGQATSRLLEGLVTGQVWHFDQLQMTIAASVAGRRRLADTGLWVFARMSASADITPIQGAVLALWAAQHERPKRPLRRAEGRKVVTF